MGGVATVTQQFPHTPRPKGVAGQREDGEHLGTDASDDGLGDPALVDDDHGGAAPLAGGVADGGLDVGGVQEHIAALTGLSEVRARRVGEACEESLGPFREEDAVLAYRPQATDRHGQAFDAVGERAPAKKDVVADLLGAGDGPVLAVRHAN